jgi:protoporphyrinogen/coproporphyrinogen III oxidase
MRTAIIGGGIAGLAAAYEFEKARAAGAPAEYTLFEAGERLGGVLSSETVQGAVLERGPDSFLTEKTAGAEFCHELGLGDELIPSNDAARKTYVVVHNRLIPLPDGLMFMVPTKLVPTAMTRLFSMKTKFRMAKELLLRPRLSEEDESVGSLVERHFGAEVVDRLVDPLLSGIYGGDAAQLSARSVLSRMVDMEDKYGSLTRGMMAAHKQMRARAAQSGMRPAQRPVFTTLRAGMQQLVNAVEAHIDAASVRLRTAVRGVERTASGWKVTAGDSSVFYDSVIFAAPAWTASTLLSSVDRPLSDDLAAIPYSSSITVNLIYDKTRIGQLPDGFGFLVPASEGRSMMACTFVHRKFLGRAPADKAVLRAFLGGVRNEALLNESDDTLIATVRRELSEILGSRVIPHDVEPEHAQVSRWRRAMAQYAVGHQERMKRVQARAQALPSLQLAGNAYDGIGIPDCIRLGRQAARDLLSTGTHVAVAAPGR